MIRHFLSRQFLLFLGVGVSAAFLNWCARIVLSFWLPFSVAVLLAYCVGMSVAFVLNAAFVFSNSQRPRVKQVRDFVLTNVAFMPIVWLVAVAGEALFNRMGFVPYPQAAAHAVAVAVPAMMTFLVYKFIAFKD